MKITIEIGEVSCSIEDEKATETREILEIIKCALLGAGINEDELYEYFKGE